MVELSWKYPYSLTRLGWSRKRLIFIYWINWSSIRLTAYFFTCFMPTSKPVFLWIAGKNLPKRPSPLHSPSWKSSMLVYFWDHSWLIRPKVLCFLELRRRPELPFESVDLSLTVMGVFAIIFYWLPRGVTFPEFYFFGVLKMIFYKPWMLLISTIVLAWYLIGETEGLVP